MDDSLLEQMILECTVGGPPGGITVAPVLPNNEFTFSLGLSLPAGTEVVCDLTVTLIGQTVQAEAPRVFLASLGGTPSTPGATGSGGLLFGPLAGGVGSSGSREWAIVTTSASW